MGKGRLFIKSAPVDWNKEAELGDEDTAKLLEDYCQ